MIECNVPKKGFQIFIKKLYCEISQGRVLTPFGFLIYINDIIQASSFHIPLFADDITLHISNSCFDVLQTTGNLQLC